MSKYKPGDIVTIKGTEFAVLDVEEGTAKDGKDKLFVLLKEPVNDVAFGENNNYSESNLRKAVNRWREKFFMCTTGMAYVSCREMNLLTMDGRIDYGSLRVWAAPLTFDEWRRYSRYIPDCEKGYWLATGYGAPGRRGATYVLFVLSNGDWGCDYCSGSWAVRPAMWVSEELIDTPEKPDLSEYSTMALLQELAEREMRNE